MDITVCNQLINSRNPKEHGFKLENQKGTIVHSLGDGWHLIQFNQFKVKKEIKVKRKKTWVYESLQWYIFETDFKI